MFNPNNFLWRWFGKLADFFLLSALWLLCSIPVITAGAATIALYDTAARCVRGSEGAMFRRFFRTFKNELLRGTLMLLLWALVGWLLYNSYNIMTQLAATSKTWTIVSIVYFCTLFIPVGVAAWSVILESRFTNSFLDLHRNALIFTFGHLPHTVAIVALLVLIVNLCINMFPLLAILPGLLAYLQSLFAERVLKKYLPAEEE